MYVIEKLSLDKYFEKIKKNSSINNQLKVKLVLKINTLIMLINIVEEIIHNWVNFVLTEMFINL